jgi:hypothetical protein
VLPELLRSEGLQWFRSITPPKTWTEFKERLRSTDLSGLMRRQLSRQIAERKQKDGEPMRIYAREILTLVRQHGGFTTEEILDQLCYNIVSEARLYLAWENMRGMDHLIQRFKDWEIA